MSTLTLISSFDINFLSVLSVQQFKDRYLAGIPLPGSITDSTLEFFMSSAQSELESYLELKLNKQIIIEEKDFRNTDWIAWGYIPTTFPVVKSIELAGWLGTTKQVTYPYSWLSTRSTNDNKNYSRRLALVPVASSTHTQSAIYSGIIPQLYIQNASTIPDYWTIKYVTGWDIPPADILDALGMLTAIKVLQIISDALQSGTVKQVVDNRGQQVLQSNGSSFGGIGFGLTSKSISIDGLSQSYSSYVNGQTGIWGARLKAYGEILDTKKPNSLLNRLRDQYGGLTMAVC